MSGEKNWAVNDMVDMSGKVVFVTGANGGIGYYSSKKMLEKNAKVYMASRDSEKSREAIKRIKEETKKEPIFIPLDLSDLHQTRKAAETFLSMEEHLDVLLNNAGVMGSTLDLLTKDQYDLQFGTNVLGHFHLTSILLPALLKSPEPRVINVSSRAHQRTPNVGIDFSRLKGPKTYSSLPLISMYERYQFYGQSKLGNILHANELARRYGDKGLVAISLHPGFVATDLMRTHTGFLPNLGKRFAISVEEGSVTQLFAANAPEAKAFSGKYLVPYGQVAEPTAYAKDEKLAKKLWEWCEKEHESY